MATKSKGEKLLIPSCPIPKSEYEHVMMAHGGGGKLTHQLISKMFQAELGNSYLNGGHDGAFLSMATKEIAFTTDSFVVDPIFFPGGDIGDLAVNGTVNDLVCCGAVPKYISLGLILEEGLPMDELWQIVLSVKKAAEKANVKIVTGDTKVVPRGKGDRIFINTSGIGEIIEGTRIDPSSCRDGDVILINGSLADHGIAIMSKREGLEFESSVKSDTASLSEMMIKVLRSTPSVHVLRDPTRGGIASALNELSDSSRVGMTLFEENLMINDHVKGACEILGLDPLYIANEGKILVILPGKDAEKVLKIMRSFKEGENSAIIGKVHDEHPGIVKLQTTIGSSRIVDMISGEQLPRIC